MNRPPSIRSAIWTPIEAPPGYAVEMDTSHPHGLIRHRLLPDGEWREGIVPADPSLEEIIGPPVSIEGEPWTGAAREFLEDFDRKTKDLG